MSDLDQTRRQLAQIPALAGRIRQFLTGATPKGDEAKIKRITSGSRPPVSVALLDLIQGRDIEWWTMLAIDEMVEADIEPDTPPTSRTPDIGENCRWLSRNADWIDDNNPDFATEIRALHHTYRRAAGDIPGARLTCPDCGNRAFIGDGMWMICEEVEEHARTVKSIENEMRFTKVTTAEVTARFGFGEDRLYQWKTRGKIKPAETEKTGKKAVHKWWLWEVFLLLNPVLAEEIERRDTTAA